MSAYLAAKRHLAELAANQIAARDKPSAFHLGLITELVREIEQLRAQPAAATPLLERKWDALWPAACGISAAYEIYGEPNTARPARGLFRALDRLDEQCARLKRVVDEISPNVLR